MPTPRRAVLFANSDWYLYNFRLEFAQELQARGLRPLLISPAGPYSPRFAALGLDWLPLEMGRRSLGPVGELRTVLRLVLLFRKERPSVVHSFTIKAAAYGTLAARIAGVPARIAAVAGRGYVFSSDEPLARRLRPVVVGLLRVALGGRRVRLILQNQDDLNALRDARVCEASQMRLIRGSGVNLKRFSPQVLRESREPDRVTVLMASRMVWDKGVGVFVESARAIQRTGRTARFLLAGTPDEGNPRSIAREVLEGWARERVVEWLGHVDDMPALLSRADVFVLPTAYGEGVPKSLIEAAACGLALVASDVPGCREVIDHEIDGLLVPATGMEGLTDTITRLLDDRILRNRLGAAAADKARRQFDVTSIIRQTLDVYREVGLEFQDAHSSAGAGL